MLITDAIEKLVEIKDRYGDLNVYIQEVIENHSKYNMNDIKVEINQNGGRFVCMKHTEP